MRVWANRKQSRSISWLTLFRRTKPPISDSISQKTPRIRRSRIKDKPDQRVWITWLDTHVQKTVRWLEHNHAQIQKFDSEELERHFEGFGDFPCDFLFLVIFWKCQVRNRGSTESPCQKKRAEWFSVRFRKAYYSEPIRRREPGQIPEQGKLGHSRQKLALGLRNTQNTSETDQCGRRNRTATERNQRKTRTCAQLH